MGLFQTGLALSTAPGTPAPHTDLPASLAAGRSSQASVGQGRLQSPRARPAWLSAVHLRPMSSLTVLPGTCLGSGCALLPLGHTRASCRPPSGQSAPPAGCSVPSAPPQPQESSGRQKRLGPGVGSPDSVLGTSGRAAEPGRGAGGRRPVSRRSPQGPAWVGLAEAPSPGALHALLWLTARTGRAVPPRLGMPGPGVESIGCR